MQNPSATSSRKEFLDNASLHAIDKIKRGRLSSSLRTNGRKGHVFRRTVYMDPWLLIKLDGASP